jgi:hypothetical protein
VRALEMQSVVVRGLALPDLAFPDLIAEAQNRRLPPPAEGAPRDGRRARSRGTGEVLVREPLQSSVLNLRLTIDVSPSAPPPLRMVTALLPKRSGTERPIYNLSGHRRVAVLK